VSINVSEQGEYYLDKEPVTYEMLRARLLELKASRPEIKIFISSDAKAQFQSVVTVLDENAKDWDNESCD